MLIGKRTLDPMSVNPPHLCSWLASSLEEPAFQLRYRDMYREYGIYIQDGGSSFIVIDFCPFCGEALPTRLRDEWFRRLRALGLEPDDPRLPAEMEDGTWWREDPELSGDLHPHAEEGTQGSDD